jgi:hypothetical protein
LSKQYCWKFFLQGLQGCISAAELTAGFASLRGLCRLIRHGPFVNWTLIIAESKKRRNQPGHVCWAQQGRISMLKPVEKAYIILCGNFP